MNSRLRILIVADEVWNNKIYGNNVLSNWFEGFDADFAEIYCSPGTPYNKCCEDYFQLTDASMAKSIVGGKRVGRRFHIAKELMDGSERCNVAEVQPQRFYKFMKSISSDGIRIVRDCIWLWGRYDKKGLKDFIHDFNPDLVFCPRLLTPKLLRLEKTVHGMTKAPIIAFTGDDEASFQQVRWSPLYWIRRYFFHRAFEQNMKIYSYYMMHSREQAQLYASKYNVPTSLLFKSGMFSETFTPKSVNSPITIVYAGRLYCNRWKTLSAIGDALKEINADGVKIILKIYTQENVSDVQRKALSEDKFVYLKGAVAPEALNAIYRESDIALHVESFDKRNRYATKVSFSTKIIDLMASSCAIMAICWEQQTGYRYLKEKDAAFCISSYQDILPVLQNIVNNPSLIPEYAQKAWQCGRNFHQKEIVQTYLRNIFQRVVEYKDYRI